MEIVILKHFKFDWDPYYGDSHVCKTLGCFRDPNEAKSYVAKILGNISGSLSFILLEELSKKFNFEFEDLKKDDRTLILPIFNSRALSEGYTLEFYPVL